MMQPDPHDGGTGDGTSSREDDDGLDAAFAEHTAADGTEPDADGRPAAVEAGDGDEPTGRRASEPAADNIPATPYPREPPSDDRLIAGRYRILQEIGRGGMGTVYVAEHVFLRKKFALKLLPESFTRQPLLVRSFLREAQAASQIKHENVISITDFGETGTGTLFYAMEHLEGEDLGRRLRRTHALHPERARHLALQICRALAHVHDAGIIHRDLKPENIFLVEQSETVDFVKILDFGIAQRRVRDENDADPAMLSGTPEYMAPEQISGDDVDPRADLYSVGCLLYEMLTGTPPFTGTDLLIVLALQLAETPQPPSERAPHLDIPRALEAVTLKALAKEAANRFQTASEMLDALVACADTTPPATASHKAVERSTLPPAAPPVNPLDLLGRAIAALDEGHPTSALDIAEELVRSYGSVDARELGPVLPLLERIYGDVCGPTAHLVELRGAPEKLDARSAFLLSRVDGHTSLAQLLLLSGMSRVEALRLLALFFRDGILVGHAAPAPPQRPPRARPT